MTNDNTVEVKFSLPPEMAILFFRLMTLKDDGDFWKAFVDACVGHSEYLGQSSFDGDDRTRVITQLQDMVRTVLTMGRETS